MKKYNYKIQWILKPEDAYKIIKLLGARSFDYICLRDYDLKEIDRYSNFIMYPYGIADIETIKYLKKQIKEYMKKENTINVELVRK
jgi:hypothetical protein